MSILEITWQSWPDLTGHGQLANHDHHWPVMASFWSITYIQGEMT